MKTMHFYVGHRDLVGGGALALYYLAWGLQDIFDLTISTDFHPGMEGFEFLAPPNRPWNIVPHPTKKPDVFLASSYTECPEPMGKVNMFYTFYPRMGAPRGYDHIFTISEYSRKAVAERWNRESYKICGGVFRDHYGPIVPKERIILNSSRFFIEGDANTFWGHSKNQHILIQAFRKAFPIEEAAISKMGGDGPSPSSDWKLILAGSVLTQQDGEYLNSCRRLAAGDPRIKFFPMLGRNELADLYARAQVFVHGMGYGRYDPAETEHYGFCVEKAVLSGCYSLVHNSGGAPELGHGTWNAPEDLVNKLKECSMAMAHPFYRPGEGLRSLKKWREEVKETFSPWA
jgi:glycosyltransferase involved in cell wall biosynthesis